MMFQSLRLCFVARAVILIAAFAVAGSAAAADRIYLKNGRVIRTSSARMVGDRVEFIQFGQQATIAADLVLRIEKDETEPEPEIPAPNTPPRTEESGEPSEPPESDSETSDDAEGDEPEDAVAPEQTQEYWRERVLSIGREKDEIAERIKELRREERAFLFSHRSTAETRQKIEAAQARDKELDQDLVDLRREARRLGIPPGWLRVRPSAT
ncbi:MAG: hypothetical protein GKS06_18230 [Acidobacteria bacterium]|nr:hypothetical protein [Acidobacteriota bacterium]